MRYGEPSKVREDVKVLNEIINRQGILLLIDVIAESVGSVVIRFKLNEAQTQTAVKVTVDEMREALLERT